jgi:hypothetical protein
MAGRQSCEGHLTESNWRVRTRSLQGNYSPLPMESFCHHALLPVGVKSIRTLVNIYGDKDPGIQDDCGLFKPSSMA